MEKFRKLKAEEIDVRVGSVFDSGYTLLLYKDARVDMNILDEQVGAENWQRKHYELKGNLYCSVGIYNDKTSQWVWKDDCGSESYTEKEKGESSDSFKRACVNWGIGRELYTSPFIFIKGGVENKKITKEEQKKMPYRVTQIMYENDAISHLVIVNKQGEVVFGNKITYEDTKFITDFQKKQFKDLGIADENACKYAKVDNINKIPFDIASDMIKMKKDTIVSKEI